MPFYLEEADILPQLEGAESALIVPCRFCPAASLAVKEDKPYLEPLRRFLQTEAYDAFVNDLRRRLEGRGMRVGVFNARFPDGFVLCLSMAGRRRALAKRAAEYDAVVVLGCEGAVQTAQDAIGPSGPPVIQGMEVQGLMNAIPTVRFPLSISLDVRGKLPVHFDGEQAGL